jgi:hypothetical protein
MLTLSIVETLSMGPEAWNDWQDQPDGGVPTADAAWQAAALGGTDAEAAQAQAQWYAAQAAQAQWDAQGNQQFGDIAAWKQLEGNLASQAYGYDEWLETGSPASSGHAATAADCNWPVADKERMPLHQRLASPILVPLPKPVMATGYDDNTELELEMLELPGPSSPPGLPPSGPKHVPTPALNTTFKEAASKVPQGPQDLELPPGLHEEGADTAELVAAAGESTPWKPAAKGAAGPTQSLAQGLTISSVDVDGTMCSRVEWLVDKFCAKLQPNMGRPLVSPPFAAGGLPNLRLMIFPDTPEAVKNARSRDRKSVYATILKKGPLSGALKLKADCLGGATLITFNLTVGSVRVGPVTYDFSEQAVHGVENFGIDWLKHVDPSDGSLFVGIEILEVRP